MQILEIVVAILIIVLLLPIITHITGFFIGVIPSSLLFFLTLLISLKIILFVIHRGDEG